MHPLPARPESVAVARRILAAVVVIQLVSFADESRTQVGALVSPQTYPNCRVSGPLIRGIDCHGYYAWLRAPLLHSDWHFDEEYSICLANWGPIEVLTVPSQTGHVPNMWSIGPAIAWSTTVVPLHYLLRAAEGTGVWAPDGYSPPYQLAVGSVTCGLSLLTLFLLYGIARRFAGPVAASAAAAGILLGTPLLVYGTVEVCMAHGPASAAAAGLLFVWVRTLGSLRFRRWFAVGALLGVCGLMRWQLVTFALLPIVEALWLAARSNDWRTRLAAVGGLGIAAASSVAVFTPQMYAWWVVFGRPIHLPHSLAPHWLNPAFWQILGSTNCSFFYWTPITLPALVGLGVAAARCNRMQRTVAGLFAFMLLVQVYLIASLVDDKSVYLGWSFGFRPLTETCVVLVPGLAVLFERANAKWAHRFAIGLGVMIAWNLALVGIYRHFVAGATGGNPLVLLMAVGRYATHRPVEAVGTATLAVWMALRLVTAFRSIPSHPTSFLAWPTATPAHFGPQLRILAHQQRHRPEQSFFGT
ncbi:MAG TPA: hypothetical protein VGJ05_18105 [Fimbriiglobus sp.]|jgi:hypothetical protein